MGKKIYILKTNKRKKKRVKKKRNPGAEHRPSSSTVCPGQAVTEAGWQQRLAATCRPHPAGSHRVQRLGSEPGDTSGASSSGTKPPEAPKPRQLPPGTDRGVSKPLQAAAPGKQVRRGGTREAARGASLLGTHLISEREAGEAAGTPWLALPRL